MRLWHIGEYGNQYLAERLGYEVRCACFAFVSDRIHGVIGFRDHDGPSVEMLIATDSRRWCTRPILKWLAWYVFEYLGCSRVWARTPTPEYVKLANRFGFKDQGIFRRAGKHGEDLYVLEMLKEECPWVAQAPNRPKPRTR